LKKELVAHVRKEIGPIATPDKIQFTDGLPKTRSGKIMRRILKKIAAGEVKELGDTTTLADPGVVDSLVSGRQEQHPFSALQFGAGAESDVIALRPFSFWLVLRICG
jgi:hypothetical protein